MKKLSLAPLIAVTIAALALVGCAGAAWPTIQNKTIVLGLEVESMGSIAAGETPLPKLRAGLIFHEGQIVQANQAASLYSDYRDINLWTASGTMRGEMDAKPAPASK